MPWYIPLLSAILGASISFCSAFAITRYTFSFAITRYTFSRQIMQEKANRLNAFQIEISVLVQFLERAISEAAPDVIVMLPPKREFENLCVIYRGNCGKIGLLSTKVAKEIIAFYANALSLSPRDSEGSGCKYDAKGVAVCIALGKKVKFL